MHDFETIEFEKFVPPKPKTPDKPKPKEVEQPKPDPLAPVQPSPIDFQLLENLDDILTEPQPDFMPLQDNVIPEAFQLPDIQVDTRIIDKNAPVVRDRVGNLEIATTRTNPNANLSIDARRFKGNIAVSQGIGKKIKDGSVSGKEKTKDNVQSVKPKNVGEAEMKEALNKMFLALLSWLEKNQSSLSPALQVFMEYKPGDLASKVQVETGGVLYDLFIKCNESSQELGILLVTVGGERADAIYLRNVGFTNESHYLSKGYAVREEDSGQVLSVGMVEEAPTREETSRFYGIFLAWWDKNKP